MMDIITFLFQCALVLILIGLIGGIIALLTMGVAEFWEDVIKPRIESYKKGLKQ